MFTILVKIEKRLSFYYRNLVGICVEGVDVQLVFPRFKINVSERLKSGDSTLRIFDKNAPVAGKLLKVGVALFVKVRAHFLNLKISYVTKAFGESTLVAALAGKTESLDETSARQNLVGSSDKFRKA